MDTQSREPSRQDASIKPRCPEQRRSYYEGPDICDINTKICLLESGDECEYYNEYLKEVADELDTNSN